MLVSWSCLIYGAGRQGLDSFVDKMAGKEERNDEGRKREDEELGNKAFKETPITLAPSPPVATGTITTTSMPTFSNIDSNPQPNQSKADILCYDDDID